jgi:two-component system chemotaxis response regulator CheY
MRTLLRSAGLEVVNAGDGEEALESLAGQPVDVIVLDLHMPRMDGRTFFREMRSRGLMTPVIIASAYGARSAQAQLGAQAAIEKPFDPDVLLEMVTRLLEQSVTGHSA